MDWTAISWLSMMVVFLAVEAATMPLISLWFAAGAMAALVVTLLGGGTGLQWATFLLVSVISLAALRPLVRRHLKPGITDTNIDSIIGSVGIVTAPVDNVTASGQVKLGAMVWTARSTSGEPIAEGTRIKVDRIEGVKVFVSPTEIPANI